MDQLLPNTRPWLGLAVWLAVTFIASAVGAAASINAEPFYDSIARPGWAPPASVFGPVWTILYAMMAVAAWLVWREAGFAGARSALVLFIAQLTVNALWSWLFFAWQLGGPALINVLVLWVLILLTLLAFWQINTVSGLLLIPYLLWVSFAAFLNYSVWQMNPGVLG